MKMKTNYVKPFVKVKRLGMNAGILAASNTTLTINPNGSYTQTGVNGGGNSSVNGSSALSKRYNAWEVDE